MQTSLLTDAAASTHPAPALEPGLPWGLTAAAAALLSACGGGATELPPPAALLNTAQAQPMRQALAAPATGTGGFSGGGAAAASSPPTPTASQLMDWAERIYGGYFPPHQSDLSWDGYTYRAYPNGNYLGVKNGRIYILGPVSGGVLGDVGALSDFGARVFAATAAYSDFDAARFLTQASLGYREADIAAVRAAGSYAAWLDAEMARPVSQSNWDWLVSKGIHLSTADNRDFLYVDHHIWQRLMTAPDGLRQRVALALSEILVVGLDGITGRWRQFQMAAWWDLLVSHAFGSYRSLLEAVTLNAAMGRYLNTAGNQKENAATGRLPDENYAREVMQLFSIGLYELNLDGSVKTSAGQPLESYTQDSVTQLARVFTGWNLDLPRGDSSHEYARKPMVLTESLHSTLAASFLGSTVPAGTPGRAALTQALDTLAAHPNVGPFIGRQLIQRLVTSNPSPAYVARVAAVFNNNGGGVRGDLGATVRAVLLDDEARDPANLANPQWGKQREPMLRAIQWARAFQASSISGNWEIGNTSNPASSLGQSPLRSPSVFNYFRPGYVPAGSAVASAGLVAPEFQLSNETSVAGYLNALQTLVGSGQRDVKPNYVNELALATDANALLDRLNLLLCAGQLGSASRATILAALNSIAASTDTGKLNRVHTAVMLVMASLDYLIQK